MDIFEVFERNADPVQAKAMSAYMRNMFPFLGIPKPKRKEISKEFVSQVRRAKEVDWDFVFACWEKDEREYQYLGIDVLIATKKTLTKEDIPRLARAATTKSWWDTVDHIDSLVGDIALACPDVTHTLIEWSTHDSIWLRRIAIDHQLTRKGRTDTALLARVIENNLGQTEFFINKAIGWSLREYSKTDPAWVRTFIDAHRDGLASLSIREASKYL